MNNLGLTMPMYGAFTDINVWNKTISNEEKDNWMNCRNKNQGNVISWQDSSRNVEITGLKLTNHSLDKVCPQNTDKYFVGNEKLDFL